MKSPLNRGGLRFYLVMIALVAGTLLGGTTSPATILSGLPFLLLGVYLHTWAKGCLRQNRAVAIIGPYRFVRHPFYLANALIDGGLVLMSGCWPLAVALPFWWLAIYIPVIRGEEHYLAEHFPKDYPGFKRRVPCLIPWRRPLPRPEDDRVDRGFRWDNPNIAGGEELPRALRILAYPLLFFVAQGFRADGLRWLSESSRNMGWRLAGLMALVSLYMLAWEFHRHQRQRCWILPPALRHPIARAIVGTGFLAAVCLVSAPTTSFKNDVPIVGVVFLAMSAIVFTRQPMRAIAAEILALLGAIAGSELVWLAPAMVAFYSAWMLDWRLAKVEAPEGPSAANLPASFWRGVYPLLALASAAILAVKLTGNELPLHFAVF